MKQTIYAALGTGDDESIISFGETPATQIPLVFTDPRLIEPAKNMIRKINASSKKEVVLVKFELSEVLERWPAL